VKKYLLIILIFWVISIAAASLSEIRQELETDVVNREDVAYRFLNTLFRSCGYYVRAKTIIVDPFSKDLH